MNGTNLTHDKIWQHDRSTDVNASEIFSPRDTKKTFKKEGIYRERCPSIAIHVVSEY